MLRNLVRRGIAGDPSRNDDDLDVLHDDFNLRPFAISWGYSVLFSKLESLFIKIVGNNRSNR